MKRQIDLNTTFTMTGSIYVWQVATTRHLDRLGEDWFYCEPVRTMRTGRKTSSRTRAKEVKWVHVNDMNLF